MVEKNAGVVREADVSGVKLGLPDTATITHAGGATKQYPARVTESYILIYPPLGECYAFSLATGLSRGLKGWRVSEAELERLRSKKKAKKSKYLIGSP